MMRRLLPNDGFSMIELIVALAVMLVGILGAFAAFGSAEKLSLVSERHSSMVQIAQREIERVEGLNYSNIGLQCGGSGQQSCPQQSTNAANPNYYVSSNGTSFQYDRAGGSSETLDIDATNGTVVPVQSWDQSSNGGLLSGSIYDFVTWSTDGKCGTGCPANNDYKRITVAVTMSGGLQPNPVFVSSVVSPNTSSNPTNPPAPTCLSGTTTVPCNSPLSGSAVTYFLHDWPAILSNPQAPSADSALHDTVGITTGGLCVNLPSLALLGGLEIAGCPLPDLMDTNPPSGGVLSTLYNYSKDLCPDSENCYPGGRVVNASGTGSGKSTDCTSGSWGTLINSESEFWVSPAVSAATTLTGAAGLTFWTQTVNPNGVVPDPIPEVSYCVELYDVPSSGSGLLSAIQDILAWPPKALGGGSYVPPTVGASGNWPLDIQQMSFAFNFSSSAVTVPKGDSIGLRVWQDSNPVAPVALEYDMPQYPSQVQLNTQ